MALVRGHGTAAAIFGLLALTVGPIGLARPDWLRPIYVGWMVLAFPIGWTVSQLILGVIFCGVFTPIGLVFRLMGRDPLHRTRRLRRGDVLVSQARTHEPRGATSSSSDPGCSLWSDPFFSLFDSTGNCHERNASHRV